jgi:hypothetical protein
MDHTFGYSNGESEVIWDVKDIWKAAENIKVINVDIKNFNDLIDKVQLDYDNDDWERVNEANIDYPIIVGKRKKGYIVIDGFHRLAKHRNLKHNRIPVKVLKQMPDPISTKGTPFKIEGLNFIWPKTNLGKECFSNNLKSLNW